MKRRFPAQSSLRRAAAAIFAVSALALSSGCTANPYTTDMQYVPADGVPADLGSVVMRDLLLVSDGTSAVLSGSVYNSGREEVTVQFSPQSEGGAPAGGSEIELAPGEQVALASEGLQFNDLGVEPGRLVPVAVRSSVGGTTIARVPVLPATGPYATVTPTS